MRSSRSRWGSAATGIATLVLTAAIVTASLQSGGHLRTPTAAAGEATTRTPQAGTPTPTGSPVTAPSVAYPTLPTKPSEAPTPLPTPWATPAAVSYVNPVSVSFTNAADGWVLGDGCDAQGACEMVMARTTDGGAHWTLGTPPADPRQSAWGLQVLAASAQDAWVWGYQSQGSGPAVFVATHDGGATWQPINIGGTVVASLAVSDGTVWALTGCPATGNPCPVQVLSSPVAGGSWTELGSPPGSLVVGPGCSLYSPGAELVRAGGRAWVLTSGLGCPPSTPELARSDNAGTAWTSLPVPCEDHMAPLALAASSPTTLMLICGAGGGWPAPQEIWGSVDGGSSWQLRSRSYAMLQQPPLPNVGELASQGLPTGLVTLEGQTAWIWGDREQDMITNDDGVTWTAPSQLPYDNAGGAEGLGFSDPLHGWTFGSDGLWTTVNGGRNWTYTPIIGPSPVSPIPVDARSSPAGLRHSSPP